MLYSLSCLGLFDKWILRLLPIAYARFAHQSNRKVSCNSSLFWSKPIQAAACGNARKNQSIKTVHLISLMAAPFSFNSWVLKMDNSASNPARLYRLTEFLEAIFENRHLEFPSGLLHKDTKESRFPDRRAQRFFCMSTRKEQALKPVRLFRDCTQPPDLPTVSNP